MVAVLYVERIGSKLVDLELAAAMLAIGLAEALPTASLPIIPYRLQIGIAIVTIHYNKEKSKIFWFENVAWRFVLLFEETI